MLRVIEVWIDFNSPLSYLGLWNLEKAIHLTKRDDLEISCRTFQIDPEFNPTKESDLNDFKIYLTEQKKLLNLPIVKKMVENSGINFNFKKVIPTNSFNAHCLFHLEKITQRRQEAETVDSLFHAYWVDGVDISDLENLQKIGVSVNLDPELINLMLTNKQVLNAIFKDEHEAVDNNVSAVPCFKFPNGGQVQGLLTIEQAQTLIQKIK